MNASTPIQPQEGKRVGRYQLLRCAGRGGMGEVWHARHVSLGAFETEVAIKFVFGDSASLRATLLDEARMLASIRSIHVASLIEVIETPQGLALVMEWVDGASVSQVLETKGPLPLGIALRIACDACAGLHAAHELRDQGGASLDVVHRDVSPQNLMVDRSGATRLIDFGIAKARTRQAEDTHNGVRGKAPYMAREQALGERIDRRSDLYALGIVLRQMLTGSLPFSTEAEALEALHQGTPIPLPNTLPSVVTQVLKRALSHDREKRFHHAHAMMQELEAAMVDCNVVTTSIEVARFAQPCFTTAATELTWSETQALSSVPDLQATLDLGTVHWLDTPVLPNRPASLDHTLPVAFTPPVPKSKLEPVTTRPIRAAGERTTAPELRTVAQRPWLTMLVAMLAGMALTLLGGIVGWSSREVRVLHNESRRDDASQGTRSLRPSMQAVPSLPTPAITHLRPLPVTTGKPASTLSCDPPYRVDADGHRVYIRECLR